MSDDSEDAATFERTRSMCRDLLAGLLLATPDGIDVILVLADIPQGEAAVSSSMDKDMTDVVLRASMVRPDRGEAT